MVRLGEGAGAVSGRPADRSCCKNGGISPQTFSFQNPLQKKKDLTCNPPNPRNVISYVRACGHAFCVLHACVHACGHACTKDRKLNVFRRPNPHACLRACVRPVNFLVNRCVRACLRACVRAPGQLSG